MPPYHTNKYGGALAECFRPALLYTHGFFVTLFSFKRVNRVNAVSGLLAQFAGFGKRYFGIVPQTYTRERND